VSYAGVGDLFARLKFFARHDNSRREIAQRGWQKIHTLFSETRVAQWLVDFTFQRRTGRSEAIQASESISAFWSTVA
jgi:spore maturation protein CgeB